MTRDWETEESIMVRRSVGALVIAAASLALVVSGSARQQDQNKKDAKPAATTERTAKVVKVDMARGILTVDDAGTSRDFKVTEQTKIVGPRGAASKERLKDERFGPGWELKLTLTTDGKKLVQIRLPLRKEKKGDK
jgi:hypothetical protein